MDIRYGREFLAERYGPGARDQRLAEFGQGRWADECRPSAWLAMQASDVSRPETLGDATGDELLGVGRAWKSLETWAFTGKLAVVRELIRRYPLNEDDQPGTDAGGLPDEWDPRLHHEVAAALGISVVAAGKLVNLTWTLDARLPGIGKALEEDRLDPGRVKLIVDETSVLATEDLFGRAEAIILAGLPGCTTWSDLARLVQRSVITVDPDGARRRRERAEREDARIRFWRESAGTCALRGTGLPTDQALAATANIEARALEYKAAAIRRPVDILRVMAYLDLINGVSVPQRAAWAQAEDEARKDEAGRAEADKQAAQDASLREATGQAREKFREKVQARTRNRSSAGNPGAPGPGYGPDDRGTDNGPDSTDGGSPGGDSPGDGPDGWSGSGDSFPVGWPADDDRGDDDRGDDLDDDGLDDGLLPEDPCADCRPGDCRCQDPAGLPCDDCGCAGCRCTTRPAATQAAPDGTDPVSSDLDGGGRDNGLCPECGATGSVGGLPIRANLTLPAGAVRWLAERASPGRDLAANGLGVRGSGGAGSGGGGPGSGHHGGLGSCPACGNRGSERIPIRGSLTFPLLTLLGLAERPGEAQGLGALDPGLVRDLAAAGARHPASELCVTVTDEQGFAIGHGCCKPIRGKAGTAIPAEADRVTFTPSAGTGSDGGFGSWTMTVPGAPLPFTVDIDPVPVYDCDHRHACAGYTPSARLRHLVQVRDGACSYPACSRHARESDFEHAQPFDKGGPTCACNAHACSRSCHRVKQSPGWTVTKPRPGWTQWTTMTGRTYLQGPWRYPA